MTLVVHILAGGVAMISGFVALYAAKGGRLHRKGGMLFVYAILTMAFCGVVIAAGRGVAPAVNIPAGVLTAYLAVTALKTVRPVAAGLRWLDLGLMVALAVGLTSLTPSRARVSRSSRTSVLRGTNRSPVAGSLA